MSEVLRRLDVNYTDLFTCPVCCSLPHDQLVLIVDGKMMGIQKMFAETYHPPIDLTTVAQASG